jgi:hypothetical protein
MKKVTRGDGMTEREQAIADTPDEMLEMFRRYTEYRGQFDTGFDALIADVEAHCRAILKRAGRTPGILDGSGDTEENYASRIVKLIQITRREIEQNRADDAAISGVKIGTMYTEAEMKFRWEPHALSGKKSFDGGSKGGKAKLGKVKISTKILLADRNRKLSYQQIANKYDMTADAVRKRIQRNS